MLMTTLSAGQRSLMFSKTTSQKRSTALGRTHLIFWALSCAVLIWSCLTLLSHTSPWRILSGSTSIRLMPSTTTSHSENGPMRKRLLLHFMILFFSQLCQWLLMREIFSVPLKCWAFSRFIFWLMMMQMLDKWPRKTTIMLFLSHGLTIWKAKMSSESRI